MADGVVVTCEDLVVLAEIEYWGTWLSCGVDVSGGWGPASVSGLSAELLIWDINDRRCTGDD